MQASSQAPYLLTVGHLLAILRARWRTIAAVVGISLALGVLITLSTTRTYEASATVLVDVKSPDPINGMLMQGMTSPAYMNTQVDLIGSETIARRVVKDLRLGESADMTDKWRKAMKGAPGDFEAWAAKVLNQNLLVAPARDSNLIQVKFTSTDPVFAANAANAYVKAYMETSLALRVDPAKEYKVFFDKNAGQLRADLEGAQKRLSDFQQKHGLLGNEETVDIETTRLNDLTQQLAVLQAEASTTRSRQALSTRAGDQTQEAMASPLVTGLRNELATKRATLREMRSQLGDRHPTIIQLKENIEELKSRVNEETSRVSGSISGANAVNAQRLGELQNSIAAQRAKVMRIKVSRDEAIVLRRDVESAQRAYDGVLAKLNQVNLESQTAQTNVSPVGSASVPTTPASPSLVRNVLSGLVLGLLIGLGAAFVRELRDQRIRTDDEISSRLQMPLVVTLPRYKAVPTRKSQLLLGGTPAGVRAKRLASS